MLWSHWVWLPCIYPCVFTQCIYTCIYAVFCLTNFSGHTNEEQKQGPDYSAQSLAKIMFLQLRKFTCIQPRQVMENRLSSPPTLLSVLQLLSCFYPSSFLTTPLSPRRLYFECAGSSASSFKERYFPGHWVEFTLAFSRYFLTLHGLKLRARPLVWPAAIMFVAVIELLSCPWQKVRCRGVKKYSWMWGRFRSLGPSKFL